MALSLAKQSETLLNWSVLALAGIVTLAVSTKVRPLQLREWVTFSSARRARLPAMRV
jgi:hypothetical protein